MPEYQAPGVYVEETRFRAKSIEGVHTSTTAFLGPTRKGPHHVDGAPSMAPVLLTSLVDFERIYGGPADLDWGGDVAGTNYLWHAVRAFFNEGGSRLCVLRVVGAGAGWATVELPAGPAGVQAGHAGVAWVAPWAGAAGNAQVRVSEHLAPASAQWLDKAPPGSLLRATLGHATALLLRMDDGRWRRADDPAGTVYAVAELLDASPRTLSVSVHVVDADGHQAFHDRLGLHPTHPSWIGEVMAESSPRRNDLLPALCALRIGAEVSTVDLHAALFDGGAPNAAGQLERLWTLHGGSDGAAPVPADYAAALSLLALQPVVSLVAAPGSTAYGVGAERDERAAAVASALIAHAERPGTNCLAVLDTPPGLTAPEARQYRERFDSSHAAIYFPWVVAANPHAQSGRADAAPTILLPPSCFVCGICARSDTQRGVHKAPANEVVHGALRFETDINFAQQELLNPAGVNCLRHLTGRGHRVWGARLASSDPEWKYVSLRRYFNYLEASIHRGLVWMVFEAQGEPLWATVRQTITDFLYEEWRNGALIGAAAEQAFFVRCDRSTMTQADLDAGRLVCEIGVVMHKPAEFMVFRLVQRTLDAPT